MPVSEASFSGIVNPSVHKDSHPSRPEVPSARLKASIDPFTSGLRPSRISIDTFHTLAESYCSMRAGPCEFRILSSYRCNRFAPVRHLLKRGNIER
jgi:hypothetical protein